MQKTLIRLARFVEEKRFGKYRAFVASNIDPEKRGRLKLVIPSVLGSEESDWALPCMPYGGLAGQGMFMVPDADAQVWVEFEEGDINKPVWVGTFWQQQSDVPEEAVKDEPTTRMWKTKSGHTLQFDDKEGEEKIRLFHPKKAELLIDENGSLSLTDANGATLTLDAKAGEIVVDDANGNSLKMSSSGTVIKDGNGNRIEMGSSGITIKGSKVVLDAPQVMLAGEGGESLIKGQSFLNCYMMHTHPTGVGPSGPPIPTAETSTLSLKVKSS